MAYDEILAERIRLQLARRKNLVAKKMFGGLGYLLKGNMLVGVWKDSLIARVGPDEYELSLLEPHAREFNVTGRPMTGWVLVGPAGVAYDDQLAAWIGLASKFVEKLPAK